MTDFVTQDQKDYELAKFLDLFYAEANAVYKNGMEYFQKFDVSQGIVEAILDDLKDVELYIEKIKQKLLIKKEEH